MFARLAHLIEQTIRDSEPGNGNEQENGEFKNRLEQAIFMTGFLAALQLAYENDEEAQAQVQDRLD